MEMNEHEKNLTDEDFWDKCYRGRILTPLSGKDFRNYIDLLFVEKLESIGLEGKNICEIGGGDAQILAHLAGKYKNSSFSVIDYSEEGCELARLRAKKEKVMLNVYQGDLFSLCNSFRGFFDLAISFGVVEHFTDLPEVLKAKRRILRKGGQMFTVIPNLSSPVYSYFCKRWSPEVYAKLIPHAMYSFAKGHCNAGLEILELGYVGSVDFNMLAMSYEDAKDKKRRNLLYLPLSRLSKLVHLFEYKFFALPGNRMLSPFIYVLSEYRDK